MNEWKKEAGWRTYKTKRSKSHRLQQSEMEELHTVLESFNYKLKPKHIHTHAHTRHVHENSREYYIIWLDCIRLCQYVMNWFPFHSIQIEFRNLYFCDFFVLQMKCMSTSNNKESRICGEIERNRWIEWQPLSMRSHCWWAAADAVLLLFSFQFQFHMQNCSVFLFCDFGCQWLGQNNIYYRLYLYDVSIDYIIYGISFHYFSKMSKFKSG